MKFMKAMFAVMLFAGPALAYTDAGLAKRSAALGGLFDGRQAVEMKVLAQDAAVPEVRAQVLTRVRVGVYVPVLPEGVEKTLEDRIVELGRKYGFIWDKGFKPIVQNDSRERPPVWQGSMVYLVRGWVQEGRISELWGDPLVKGVWPDGRIEPAGGPGTELMGPPRHKDIFKELEACHVVDVKFVKRPSLQDALKMLGACMEALSAAYGAQVSAEADRYYQKPYVQGFADAIAILVRGELAHYRAVEDLEAALDLRQGRILTFKAWVDNKATLRVSSLQPVVDQCVQPMLLAPIKDAEDFVQAYRGCLEGAEAFRIEGVYDVKERGRERVIVISKAGREIVDGMNGKVVVAGEKGSIEIQIRATGALRRQLRESASIE